MSFSEHKIALLRNFVDYICEQCHLKEGDIRKDGSVVSKLEPHRLKRGNSGGTYEHRNIKMLCSVCHRLYHSEEF